MPSANNNLPDRPRTLGTGTDPIEAAIIDGTLTWRKTFILMAIRTPGRFIALLVAVVVVLAPGKLADAYSMLAPLVGGLR
ncbi:hypothetical protein [Nocardia sp. NPDC050717]|uniref:hypothetical protein n=1 Tax=Nocardia sp. NPDC050717 TaxID=3157221 RepID=UPI0033DDA1B4